MQALFIVMAQDTILPVINAAQSTTAVDQQPQLGANSSAIIYFIFFIWITVFLVLNLYAGGSQLAT